MMKIHVHPNAEADLDRHFETDEEGVGYLDSVIALIAEKDALRDSLAKEDYHREYEKPIGELGMEVKRIVCLWKEKVRVLRIRFDDDRVSCFRIIYTVLRQKMPNQTYQTDIWILAVVQKDADCFNYEPNHPLIVRIKNDYTNLNNR